MTTVLFGSSGLIGRTLVGLLHDADEPVVCVDVDLSGTPDLDGVSVVEGDVTDSDAVAAVVDDADPDRIVHLAYIVGRDALADVSRSARVNLLGVDNVFRAAAEAGVPRVVWASTLGVYGSIDERETGVVDEDAPRPYAAYTAYPDASYYMAQKHLNEYQARLYADRAGMAVCAIRPSTVFGPGRTTGYPWVGTFVEDAVAGRETPVPLHPTSTMNLVYVEDAARLFAEVTLAPSVDHDVYNTGGHLVTIAELAEAVEEALGGRLVPDEDADPSSSPNISNERARAEFGFELTSLPESLERHGAAVG